MNLDRGDVGRNWDEYGRGNHNQNICMKNINFNKRRINKMRILQKRTTEEISLVTGLPLKCQLPNNGTETLLIMKAWS